MVKKLATVQLEKNFVIELIDTNLAVIKTEIELILANWNQTSSEEMIEKTRKGELAEAELDAISLTNLLEKQKTIEKVLLTLGDD